MTKTQAWITITSRVGPCSYRLDNELNCRSSSTTDRHISIFSTTTTTTAVPVWWFLSHGNTDKQTHAARWARARFDAQYRICVCYSDFQLDDEQHSHTWHTTSNCNELMLRLSHSSSHLVVRRQQAEPKMFQLTSSSSYTQSWVRQAHSANCHSARSAKERESVYQN